MSVIGFECIPQKMPKCSETKKKNYFVYVIRTKGLLESTATEIAEDHEHTRFFTLTPRKQHIAPALIDLRWLPMTERVEYKILVTVK